VRSPRRAPHAQRRFVVRLDLRVGRGRGRVLASDLTTAYVHFNSAYTT
jgi:N-acetylglutamate synthase/N-acetylornithine aminotransferase